MSAASAAEPRRWPGTAELRWWLAAVCCLAAFAVLGAYVSHRAPLWADVQGSALLGQATALAAFFTLLGRTYAVAGVAVAAAAVAALSRANVRWVGALVVSQALSQASCFGVKLLFARPRPDYWLLQRETDFSYPSGHAVTAIVFYAGVLLLVARGNLPRQVALPLTAALAVCVVGIPWSRLALGAHYLTDVAGGLLFGACWLCAAIALAYRYAATGRTVV